MNWLCSQFGAREKYAIPRALHREGMLTELCTDLWVKPGSLLRFVNGRAAGRYHPDLAQAKVRNFNFMSLYWNVMTRVSPGFQIDTRYDKRLSRYIPRQRKKADIFFGYSYSSRRCMKIAKANGFSTVLGQINPGPREAAIVIEEYKNYKNGSFKPFVPDERYWDLWREEAQHADRIIVNSEWSKRLLMQDGIEESKLVEIPLCFEEPVSLVNRIYPSTFTKNQPLRLLYLGGIELRKGFHILKRAMRKLTNLPVVLDVVGGLKSPDAVLADLPPNIIYHKSVAPRQVSGYYKNADVFIFPTLSDGFGLTLLEAQAHKLPVICSTFCARVITNDVNGIVLPEVTSASIVDSVTRILDQPALLEKYTRQSVNMENYSMAALAKALNNIKFK
ncbi:MAG TPA: glycosyltransferase family 4 protein [Cyclobacteriaceae bacterium]|nr:glycosyltransferase family 4 protein [Cyclobacteriaceae bacterium]